VFSTELVCSDARRTTEGNVVHVESYVRPDQGPFPEDEPKRNQIRFTPRQIESVGSGAREGLTLVVGPPGSGKVRKGKEGFLLWWN
jgi:intron-binding protein aquarius